MNKVKCVQPWFSMYICAKQAQRETKSPLVHPRTEKSIGVYLLVSPIVYPLDILRMGVARWTFVLGCVWLGHRVITNHVCAQAIITLVQNRPLDFSKGNGTNTSRLYWPNRTGS